VTPRPRGPDPATRRLRRRVLAHLACGPGLLAAASCRAPAPPLRTRIVVSLPVRPTLPPPVRSISEVTNTVFRHAFEPLTELTPDLRVVPCLAESWYSPDDRTWVFKLRRGVRRHDGRLLEVQDVAAQLRRVLGSETRPAAAGLTVTAIEAVDDSTLVLRTAAPELPGLHAAPVRARAARAAARRHRPLRVPWRDGGWRPRLRCVPGPPRRQARDRPRGVPGDPGPARCGGPAAGWGIALRRRRPRCGLGGPHPRPPAANRHAAQPPGGLPRLQHARRARGTPDSGAGRTPAPDDRRGDRPACHHRPRAAGSGGRGLRFRAVGGVRPRPRARGRPRLRPSRGAAAARAGRRSAAALAELPFRQDAQPS
jgi:hypothetical protein